MTEKTGNLIGAFETIILVSSPAAHKMDRQAWNGAFGLFASGKNVTEQHLKISSICLRYNPDLSIGIPKSHDRVRLPMLQPARCIPHALGDTPNLAELHLHAPNSLIVVYSEQSAGRWCCGKGENLRLYKPQAVKRPGLQLADSCAYTSLSIGDRP